MSNSLIRPFSRFPSRQTLLLSLLLFILHRHSHTLLRPITSTISSFRRIWRTIAVVTSLISCTAADLHEYLYTAPNNPNQPLPLSIHRLLHLLSHPKTLPVIRAITTAVAQPCQQQQSSPSPAPNPLVWIHALSTPQGLRILHTAVETAVHEATRTLTPKSNTTLTATNILDTLVTDRGRALVSQVAKDVVETFMRLSNPNTTTASVSTPSTTPTKTPVSTPTKQRTKWQSPTSKELVRRAREGGVMERLAVLAIRDKEFMRDMVRTVVGETVRTYLTTGKSLNATASDALDAGGVWKMMVKSVVADLKKAVTQLGQVGGGWVVF